MDLTSVLGAGGALAGLAYAFATGGISSVFINAHGILIVLVGTFLAMLINTPLEKIFQALGCVRLVFFGRSADLNGSYRALVQLSRDAHSRGVSALREASPAVGDGFLHHAAQTALEFKDAEYVQEVLESEVVNEFDRNNEIVNIFRTAAVLAPMFGLLGTLIGIVDVLKQISDPEQVGRAMGVAVTTAFYGILLANMVAIPLAGKLRLRFWEQYLMKQLVVEGVSMILKGSVPALVERRLQSYLKG